MTATRTKALAAAAALLAVPALSSCGGNFDAQTDQMYTPADGVNDYEGSVDVLNALIVSGTPGSGRFIAGLNNDSTESLTLESVEGVGESAEVTFSIEGGETELPARGYIQLAHDDAAMVVASGSAEALQPGKFVRVSLTFAGGQSAELDVPVLGTSPIYDQIELPTGTSDTESVSTEE
ncbi:MAG TPA: hypothetical protein VFG72_10905 [Marmoricola sp.]|nr:hypothetical protein [Marmoricola sp.]